MNALIIHEETEDLRVDPTLPRGTDIPKNEIERASGMKCTDPRYSLLLLRLTEAFRSETATSGDPKLIRIQSYGLRVLTDSEAVVYTDDNFWGYLHRAIRTHKNGAKAIRLDHLEDSLRAAHNEQATRRSRMVQSIQAQAELDGTMARLGPRRIQESEGEK